MYSNDEVLVTLQALLKIHMGSMMADFTWLEPSVSWAESFSSWSYGVLGDGYPSTASLVYTDGEHDGKVEMAARFWEKELNQFIGYTE